MANSIIFSIILFVNVLFVYSYNEGDDFIFNTTEMAEQYKEHYLQQCRAEETAWTGAALVLNTKTNEVNANNIFMKYKLEELRTYRNITSENPAAMHFHDAKDKIENSKVYQIIKKMPKGANLYIHTLGSVSSDWLVKNLSYIDGLKLCSLNGSAVFTFRKNIQNKITIPGVEGTYLSNCQDISAVRKRNAIDIYDYMLKYFFDMERVKPKGETLTYREGVQYLMNMYMAITDAVNYKPAYEKFHYQMLQELYDDNIMYAEVRTQFLELYDNTNKKYKREETVKTLIEVVRRFKRTHEHFLGVRFIHGILRHAPLPEVRKEIEVFKKLQKQFPKYIIGLDFVGWEDFSPPLETYLQDIIKLKQNGYNFYFLAGETNRQNKISDSNLYNALLLQTKRFGQGYALWKHPIIMDKIKSQSIPIEICPTTNQICGLVADLRNHPGGIYISRNLPLVVGSDSPGFLGTTGLSTDFYYTIMSLASNKADLKTLKQLALNSIKHSALPKKKAENAKKLFEANWNTFVNEVVCEEAANMRNIR